MYKYKDDEVINFDEHLRNRANILPLDERLIIELLTIRAPSGLEDPVRKYIIEFIKNNNIDCVFDVDTKGNMYIIKGKSSIYPCIVAHMDEVCGDESARVIIDLGNVLIGMNPQTGEAAGCPGDDRAGIYCALEMLRVLPHCKVCFFVEEEAGAHNGSGQAPLSFFRDCAFILQADRTDNYEFIMDSNGGQICSEALIEECAPLVYGYDYQFSDMGSFTDCGVLSSRGVGISCVNLAAGYYDSHTCYEKVCKSDLENAMNLMYKLCLTFGDRQWTNAFTDTWTSHYSPRGELADDSADYIWSSSWNTWVEKEEYVKELSVTGIDNPTCCVICGSPLCKNAGCV